MAKQEDVQREEERIRKVYAKRERQSFQQKYSYDNPANRCLSEERDQRLLAALQRHGCLPLAEKRILDLGCGRGYRLRKFLRWGAKPENLFGIDLLPQEIEKAKQALPPQVTLEIGNAHALNWADQTFDLICQYTVFSSVLNAELKARIAQEMLRVLKPEGFIIWYDFFVDNPWNRNVRGIGKREIRRLFPACWYWFERMTLAPPLARALGGTIPQACRILSRLRVFSTHYLAFIKPTT